MEEIKEKTKKNYRIKNKRLNVTTLQETEEDENKKQNKNKMMHYVQIYKNIFLIYL